MYHTSDRTSQAELYRGESAFGRFERTVSNLRLTCIKETAIGLIVAYSSGISAPIQTIWKFNHPPCRWQLRQIVVAAGRSDDGGEQWAVQ